MRRSPSPKGKRDKQVYHDAVVVSGVERHIPASRVAHGAHYLERVVAAERRDLDGDETGQIGQPAPELVAQVAATDGGLEIETKERKHAGDGAAVRQQFLVGCVLPGGQREQCRVVPQFRGGLRFGNGLGGAAHCTRHQRHLPP